MSQSAFLLQSPIEYLKGIGPAKGELLKKELNIFTFNDLLWHLPFRYIDKTKFTPISQLDPDSGEVLVRGVLRRLESAGEGRKKRLVGKLRDETGMIELIWFQGVRWLEDALTVGKEYVVYGKIGNYGTNLNISHPEMEELNGDATEALTLDPVYPSTEKLRARGMDGRGIRRITAALFEKLTAADVPENLPSYITERFKLVSRVQALRMIHFPKTEQEVAAAQRRLKFEELFYLQLRLLRLKWARREEVKGFVFDKVGDYFHNFYKEKLPFELTNAQKRVIKEIRVDLGEGIQMNRLVQGDVGSGKTMVALLSMLIAMDNGYQACMLAPTEILAQQHYTSMSEMVEGLGIHIDFLSGSIKGKKRQAVLDKLANGETHILVGTHAIIEDWVVFKQLGLSITDEQHRFGVEQRSKLWKKSHPYPPHVLVMSATPIPRTLAMTLYGDLDVSVIDELPPGRKPVTTSHKTENHRWQVLEFMKTQIAEGRQVYVVYPLIEESETVDLLNLQEGYEALSRYFPISDYQISVVHGKMKAADKDFEMQRFISKQTQIMVATTVIEVGVNVPNASVMVIENAERFGLSQLHQLRGRVGRGADQSYCILMTSFKLSADGKQRIHTMVSTTNGFDIAEADLALRGPGNIEGRAQSGMINLAIADLAKDGKILQAAREMAQYILEKDPTLVHPANAILVRQLSLMERQTRQWSRIS